jgi:hypothetical protein
MFVLAADSSRKTSFPAFTPSNFRRQASRSAAMSSRSCSLARSVFFIGQIHGGKDIMDGWQSAFQTGGSTQFTQRQVGLLVQ